MWKLAEFNEKPNTIHVSAGTVWVRKNIRPVSDGDAEKWIADEACIPKDLYEVYTALRADLEYISIMADIDLED